MTKEHARAFQEVADAFTCIIMSRSVNLDCTGLIAEGYASKGFKVKAKSCNWGPASGFVAADTRMSKLGLAAKKGQQDDITNALQAKAGTTPVLISDKRVQYLLHWRDPKNPNSDERKIYPAPDNKSELKLNLTNLINQG